MLIPRWCGFVLLLILASFTFSAADSSAAVDGDKQEAHHALSVRSPSQPVRTVRSHLKRRMLPLDSYGRRRLDLNMDLEERKTFMQWLTPLTHHRQGGTAAYYIIRLGWLYQEYQKHLERTFFLLEGQLEDRRITKREFDRDLPFLLDQLRQPTPGYWKDLPMTYPELKQSIWVNKAMQNWKENVVPRVLNYIANLKAGVPHIKRRSVVEEG